MNEQNYTLSCRWPRRPESTATFERRFSPDIPSTVPYPATLPSRSPYGLARVEDPEADMGTTRRFWE